MKYAYFESLFKKKKKERKELVFHKTIKSSESQ